MPDKAYKPERDMQIVFLPISQLVPYAQNARTHSEAQVAQIAASIREFGWTNPVLIDAQGGIIAGHGRVMAAKLLDLSHVPTVQIGHLTDAQRRAYVLADNQLALNAGWDMDLLKIEVAALDAMDFDLTLTGFDTDFLAGLLVPEPEEGLTDPDEAPALPDIPVSLLGDVWILGPHRLVCGDSTDPLVVEKALNGVTPLLMVTDPPYGVEYKPEFRDRSEARVGKKPMKRANGEVKNDDRADWREAWALFPGQIAYVWHGMKAAGTVFSSLEACDFEVRAEIVWKKRAPAVGLGRYSAQHESCFYAAKGKLPRFKGKSESTVWEIDHAKSDTGHGTQKPVECMKRPIEHNSSPGQAVYEPFAGSGTLIIAAQMTGRACHAVELDAAYVDVAVKRWQSFTGQEAIHEATGLTFSQMEQDRK